MHLFKKILVVLLLLSAGALVQKAFADAGSYSAGDAAPVKTHPAGRISGQTAQAIARKDAGGYLGTWVRIRAGKNGWYISSYSKSERPPNLYVVDFSGKILYKNMNTDAEKPPALYTLPPEVHKAP